MRFRWATPNDEGALKKFFESEMIKGAMSYRVVRPAGFFDHAKQDYLSSHVLVLENSQGDLDGFLSLNVREAFADRWIRMAWLTDLRLTHKVKSMFYFYEHFMEHLLEFKKQHQIDHFFSFVNKTNATSFNTLIRPRVIRESQPRFHLMSNFFRISIFSDVSFLSKPLKTIRIRALSNTNIDAYVDYLARKKEDRYLSYKYSRELIENRLSHWKNLSKENFLLAYDGQGRIIGSCCPWNCDQTQEYYIEDYNDFYQSMRQTLKFSSFLGLTKKMPRPSEKANFYFLTHLQADNPYIFHRLLDESLKFCDEEQYITYASFEGDNLYRPPKGYVYTKNKFGFYQVVSTKEEGDILVLPRNKFPDFEMAFI